MAIILAIDDDPNMRALLADLLSTSGHTVMLANDGFAGLKMARGSPPPELVITDILMPRKDGLEIIRSLRRDFPKLPVMAISGNSPHSPVYLKTAELLGARRILAKPVTNEALLSAVAEALNQH